MTVLDALKQLGERVGWVENGLQAVGVPVGSVQAYSSLTIPDGWLLCDGRAVSRAEYADLFALVGTSFGEGDGSETFNVPDMIDRFALGSDKGLGEKGGEAEVALTTEELPATRARVSYLGAATTTMSLNTGAITGGHALNFQYGARQQEIFASFGGDQPHNNMPPFVRMLYIIKY